MQAGKALKTAAAFMLSVAMLATGAACGTSDDSDASASKSSSKSSELTGYDVSGVKKDDAIAKMLPDYVTKDGKLTIGMDTSYAPAEFPGRGRQDAGRLRRGHRQGAGRSVRS